MRVSRIFAVLVSLSLPFALPTVAAAGPYVAGRQIEVGGEGGWDYLTVDSAARRLYVAHATQVVVIDLDKGAVAGEIAPAQGVHGIAIAPELGRGFVTNGRANTVSIFDLKTLQIAGAVATGANPDAILYDPARGEVYAFNHSGHSATVFAAASGTLRATIPLPGVVEFAVLDEKAGRVYVNIEDAGVIAAIDTGSHAVTATWPVAPGTEPTGLAFDPGGRRLFAACGNQKLVMLDVTTGKVLATAATGAGSDGAAFDPGTGYAFASSGDGTLTVAKPGADGLSVVQVLKTAARARTLTLDPESHRVYTATTVAGVFTVLEYEMAGTAGR